MATSLQPVARPPLASALVLYPDSDTGPNRGLQTVAPKCDTAIKLCDRWEFCDTFLRYLALQLLRIFLLPKKASGETEIEQK